MRTFAAVFTREIAERRLVFAVALLAGFLAILVSLLTGWSKPGAADIRLLAAAVSSAILVLTFGIAFGGSVIAGATAEKRLSFFYARPIPAAAIWSGKLAAALALTIGSALLAVLPGYVAGGGFGRSSLAPSVGTGEVVAVYVVGAILVVLLAHAAVTIARLRSPWIAVDVLLAGAGKVAVLLFLRSLVRNEAVPGTGLLASPLVHALLFLVILSLLAASAVQVAEGRVDARRAHGAFSATLWGILGTVVLALGLYTWWVASATARDLAGLSGAAAAPRGTWVAARGSLAAGRGTGSFLFDSASGRSIRIQSLSAVFTRDGERAAWAEPGFGFFERRKGAEISLADLVTGRVVETGLECGSTWTRIAFSPSGRRLAFPEGKALAAYDVSEPAKPRQLAAFAIAAEGRAFEFLDEDTIRVFPRLLNAPRRSDVPPTVLEITELSLPSKKSEVTGRFTRETLPYLRLSADGRYFLGTHRSADDGQVAPATLSILDGRTGAPVAMLAEGMKNAQARFLSGNRLVVVGFAGARAEMKIFLEGEGGWGAPARSVDLGPAARAVLGGEIAPGRVAVSLITFEENPPASRRAAKLLAVDAASGAVSPLSTDLVPVDRFSWWLEAAMPPAEAGAPWTSLFTDADGRLVRLDPATGAQTVVLGGSK